jgi:hypothetical protein
MWPKKNRKANEGDSLYPMCGHTAPFQGRHALRECGESRGICMRHHIVALSLLVLFGTGCPVDDGDGSFKPGNGTDTSPDDDTSSGTETDDPEDTNDTSKPDDTGSSEESTGFDDPGNVDELEMESDGTGQLSLEDVGGDSNIGQEFFLVLVNTALSDDEDEGTGYQMWYERGEDTTGDTGAKSPLLTPTKKEVPPSTFRDDLRRWVDERGGPRTEPFMRRPASFGTISLGPYANSDDFEVRSNFDDSGLYSTVVARPYALGDNIVIYVDDDVPVDWDEDCDGEIEVTGTEIAGRDAQGFDNCDLQTIADIVDLNIVVNLRAQLGNESDLNGDGAIIVLITPVLNSISLTAADDNYWHSVVESYADPEVDLNDYDPELNPGSDEAEIIYMAAPDPSGYFNYLNPVGVDAYTSVTLSGLIARNLASLISYNFKVLQYSGSKETQWLDQALGAIAADLTGFGATYFDDVWDYLDAPHLAGLTVGESSAGKDGGTSDDGTNTLTASLGAQYLFMRWLVDNYGESVLADIVQTDALGATAVETATGEEFADLVMEWQLALLTSPGTDGDKVPGIDEGYATFADAVILDEPTDPSKAGTAGVYYGANGYQMGINLRGENYFVEGGTTDEPLENSNLLVVLDGPDFMNCVPGFDCNGYVAGNYGAHVTRITGLQYDDVLLKIQLPADATSFTSPGKSKVEDSAFIGSVVRWNEPVSPDYVIENVFSPSDATAVDLPELPEYGDLIYAFGDISGVGAINVVADGAEESYPVYDVDRYRLDLSDYTLGEVVEIAVWLDRRYEDLDGEIAPYDTWLAIAPEAWVPAPTVEAVSREMCEDDDADDFTYPISVLDYLYYQEILADAPFSDSAMEDPCGSTSEDLSCEDDWDEDGVADADEPTPEYFVDQVNVQRCSIDDYDEDEPYEYSDWVDADEIDEDEDPAYDRTINSGGRSDSSGEDSYLRVTLYGGESYLIVVGGNLDEGAYELNLRRVDD